MNGNDVETLVGFLEYQRGTFGWKCEGLDAVGLRATAAASTMTLGGMMKHLAIVEDWWCARCLMGTEAAPWWRDVDWDADRDWEWHSAADDSPEWLREVWGEAVARSRANVKEALAAAGLDQVAKRSLSDGGTPSLRWVLLHMVEEYARHNGHADLIRESIDGQTGE